MTSNESADISIEIDSEVAALEGSEAAESVERTNTELTSCEPDPSMPEKDLFENAFEEHFNCDEDSDSPKIADATCNIKTNTSENAACSSMDETPAILRASHDTLDVELSDDDSYYSADEGSDATSSNVGITTYGSDGAPNEYWTKEYVWGNKSNLDQRSILPNDREIHHLFQIQCSKLLNFSLAHSAAGYIDDDIATLSSANTPLQAAITAKELLPQLDCRYAYMHGGRDIHNSQIICLPHFAELREITDDHFRDIFLYLTSLQRSNVSKDDGFTVVVDRRRDKWSSLRKVLLRLASNFPGNLKAILVLRPASFLQRKAVDLGFRMIRDQLGSKIQIVMLSGVNELKKYIEPQHIPEEFGGGFVYDHRTWIRNRMLLEDFASHAVEIGENLNEYGCKMGETELPLDVMVSKTLLQSQQAVAKYHKKKLHSLIETATTLKNTINLPCSGSNTTPASYSLEAETLESVLTIIEDVKAAFEKCWDKHEEKLKHCLELRQFQQDYDEAISKLSIYQKWNEQQSNHVGSNSSWVEYLINEAERMKENFLECSVEYSLLTLIGSGMMESDHYVNNPIESKCNELERILTDLKQSFDHRIDFLTRINKILLEIEELNLWCDKAMSLLAGQGIEKAQNLEGAQQAMAELEEFFGKKISRVPVIAESVSANLENYMKAVNSRFQEVVQLFEKRQAYFQKTITRYSERPVQRVEPSVKLDYATTNYEVKKEETTENSASSEQEQEPASPPRKSSDPKVQLSHVMNELLTTEEVYVKELQTIIEGYGDPIDNESCETEIPKELKGNRNVLFGNIEEIYAFHSKLFLKDLEECKNTPALVGKCFTNRKSDFEMYSKYCQNSAKSEQLRVRIGENHPFFEECKQKLGHLLPISAYLLKPIQRITKYQLLLKQMLKYSNAVNVPDVQAALDTMLLVLKHVNDSIHRKAIVGYQGDLDLLGDLLLQAPFSIQSEHRKVKVKNLTRHRFSKTSQRHLFLFEKELLFCKQQSVDSTDNNLSLNQVTPISTVSGGPKKQCYAVKNSLRLNSVGITETAKGDPKKFEIWYQGREEVYTLLAVSTAVKQEWVSGIKKALLSLPKIEISLTVAKDKKKGSKARRRKSQSKKPRSAVNLEKHKSQFEFPTSARMANVRRSASVGKDDRNIIIRTDQESFEPDVFQVCNNEIELIQNAMKRSRKSASLPKLNNIPPVVVSEPE